MEQSTLSSEDARVLAQSPEQFLLESLSDQIAEMQDQINGLLALLREYGDQIQPTLDAMSKSPIMKMLGVKSNA